ncbi:MAG TPA: uridine kinase [Clostridia bacterium]|nr:uridine kinase [Clostridia bacterium]HQF99854.1 uridine kinase [Clostridia bacterium]HQH65329.1 uridine kinase [Clostridia bacterium]HQJ91705.1 uridine kinase [Clostridia bacterium]HRR35740.1 uridine kinase [Clostridia bacterium]
MMDILVIGIAGGTGSGKTTLTNRLKERFGKDISVIRHDDYYRSQDDISFEERVKTNYDHPDSFETDLLIEHLKQLKNGHSIECPVYSFSEHTRTKETRKIDPTKVIIVEGILIFQNPELLNMLDIRIFVDTDPDVRILRRILRDVKERGRSLDSVVTQYLSTVKPMHEQFVEPSKRNADIIVLEGGYNLVALDMIIQRIQGHVEATDE